MARLPDDEIQKWLAEVIPDRPLPPDSLTLLRKIRREQAEERQAKH
jgi:hypothetical protein